MWLLLTIIHCFFLAIVNYVDEHLTHSTKIDNKASLHERIGGVVIVSLFLCIISVLGLGLFFDVGSFGDIGSLIGLLSAIPFLIMVLGYFYALQSYSAHLVVPLFGLSSIFLLLFEYLSGYEIGPLAICAVLVLFFGSYILDRGSFKFSIPSKAFFIMIPTSFFWAFAGYLFKVGSEYSSPTAIYFWQLVGLVILGLLLFLFRPYRKGLIHRIKFEGSKFILPSILNEASAQIAYWASAVAFATAPVAAFVSGLSGIQSIFLLIFFFLFPLNERNSINKNHVIGILLIFTGILIINIYK